MLTFCSVLLFVLGLIIMNVVPHQGFVKRTLHPVGLFILYFACIHFLVPVLQSVYQVGRFDYFLGQSESMIVLSALICLLYLIVVVGVYGVCGRPRLNYLRISEAIRARRFFRSERLAVYFCAFATLFGFMAIGKIVMQFGEAYAAFMLNRINLLAGYGYFLKALSFSVPLVVMVAGKRIADGKVLIGTRIIAVFLIVFGASLLIGSRSQALILVPFVILTWLYANPNKMTIGNLKTIVIGVCVIFLLSVFLGDLRRAVKMDDVANYQFGEDYSEKYDSPSALKEAFVSFGHTELLAFVLDHDDRYSPAFGKTYLAGLVAFVPRVIWSAKPVGAGPMLANIVKPGSYQLGQDSANSSLTTGVVIESYLNFGIFGVLFVAGLHGWLLAALTRYANRIAGRLDFALFLLALHFSSVLLVNAEFLGAFSGFAFIFVSVWLISRLRT